MEYFKDYNDQWMWNSIHGSDEEVCPVMLFVKGISVNSECKLYSYKKIYCVSLKCFATIDLIIKTFFIS